MSKRAEEAALKRFPEVMTRIPYQDLIEAFGGKEYVDFNSMPRGYFQLGYEQAEKELGWISVKDRLPEERKYESDTLQGHHEWMESDRVFVLDDRGVAMVDSLRNGKFWLDGKKDCDGFPHYIEYWMPIPKLPKEEENG